jgi:hypothetical protein
MRKAQTAQPPAPWNADRQRGAAGQSLNIARGIMTNRRMADSLELSLRGKARRGSIRPFSRRDDTPTAHLLSIGETMRLDAMFLRAAEIYDGHPPPSSVSPLCLTPDHPHDGIAVSALIPSMMLAITD